ncbi:hypothetical protein [uncultured Tenacibaculum sp.]|uniref:hypothetical protein n=1 Tax=uncultured Tenacibaculum sp. TaxID=174713 RepID=UPI0026016321|nr:hypothetical protein [uncultured Tenacibaculum sp.]
MKNLVIVFVLFLGMKSFSQKFEKTNDYFVTEVDDTTRKEYWDKFPHEDQNLPIFLKDKHNNTLLEISVNLMAYDETTVEILKIDNFSAFNKILRVSTTHTACCSNTISYYLCISKNGKITQLPQLNNTHCDGPEPWVEYVFPNQKDGEKDKILVVESNYNVKKQNYTLTTQKSYALQNGSFELIPVNTTQLTYHK